MSLGITQLFLENNFKVSVYSRKKDQNETFLKKLKKVLIEKAKHPIEKVEIMLKNLSVTTDLNDAKDNFLIIEAVVESIDIKKEYFKRLDVICDENTIFATNTSSLSITELSSAISRTDKIIGTHFFNPVSLMKLVEIIKGMGTSDSTVEKIKEILSRVNKEFILVEETPGFIVNRLLIPMINEAVCLLETKSATIEDIDRAMLLGANHPMGPLALADLIGNDVVLKIMEVLYNETSDSKYRPSYLLKKYVRNGFLGRKTKEGFYKY